MSYIRADETPHVDKVRRLLGLAGIGVNGAWLLVYEFFAWRKLHNRKQAGALVGLFGVARLAERHGVRVRLRARSPRGLIALVWLPDGITERATSPSPWSGDRTILSRPLGYAPAVRAPHVGHP